MKRFFTLLLIGTFMAAGAAYSAPTANELWNRIQILKREGPSKQQVSSEAERNAILIDFVVRLEKACDEFIQEFPNDKRLPEAKLEKLNIEMQRPEFDGHKLDMARFEGHVKELVDSAESSMPVKSQASFMLLATRVNQLIAEPNPAKLPDIEKQIDAFSTTYPNSLNRMELTNMRLELYEKNAPAKATEILTQLAESKDQRVAMEAKRRLKMKEIQTKPLDLKFTAVDGAEFDLAKLRGKVVLLDFWATWCGPCRAALPQVLDLYKKHHGKGFEIVGISLDNNKEKLLAFTKDNEMTWTQYFDGKGWNNTISSGFGINSIPRMWLVDKKGIIRSMEADEDLGSQIVRLLAE